VYSDLKVSPGLQPRFRANTSLEVSDFTSGGVNQADDEGGDPIQLSRIE
jgi:hypothetical protein